MNDNAIYRVMPPDLHSRPTAGSPGYQYALGVWTEPVADPKPCQSGYHTLTPAGLLDHTREGDVIVRCKRRGPGGWLDEKQTNESVMPVEVVGTMTAPALRLFAVDCAEDALPCYTALYPNDMTLEVVIHTIRAFALGGATGQELDAARDAAQDASWAAQAAAWAAGDVAGGVPQAIAGDAAWAVAGAVDWVAPRAAARQRLGKMLLERVRELL